MVEIAGAFQITRSFEIIACECDKRHINIISMEANRNNLRSNWLGYDRIGLQAVKNPSKWRTEVTPEML